MYFFLRISYFFSNFARKIGDSQNIVLKIGV